MAFILPGQNSYWMTTGVDFIEDTRETAWAEKHIQYNPALKWIVAKYVEADNPNNNRQFWSYEDLQFGKPSIAHSPINLLHQSRRVIGTITHAEMLYPKEEAAADDVLHPFIEVVGPLWAHYFPEEVGILQRAHAEGGLTISMECVAKEVECAGDQGCGKIFPYKGPKHSSYCNHLNDGNSIKQLNEPHFLGAGLLVPPIKPGWNKASVTEISKLTSEYSTECEQAYEGIKTLMPNADALTWESMMAEVVKVAVGPDDFPHGQGTSPVREPKDSFVEGEPVEDETVLDSESD